MATGRAMILIDQICQEVLHSSVDLSQLATGIIKDGGVDAQDLSIDDVLEMLREAPDANWNEAMFAFGEMMAGYSTFVALDGHEFIRAVSISLLLSIAIRRGCGTWDTVFDYCQTLMCKNIERVAYDSRMKFFEYLIRGDFSENW